MEIPIWFLGTGQAVPTAKRNHTAMLLRYKDENILIDCGEGTQRQFRKAKLNPCKLTRILITHWHGDHVLGLPGLFQTLVLNNYNRKLHIYGPEDTKKYVKKMLEMFVPPGKIDMEIKEVRTGKVFETEDFVVNSRKMKHGSKCLAYSFEEKDKLKIDKEKLSDDLPHSPKLAELKEGNDVEINGQELKADELTYEEKGRKATFIMDTAVNDNMVKLAKHADLLVEEATYDEDKVDLAKERGHLTAKQAAQVAKEASARRLILTHLSQRYEGDEDKLLNEAKEVFENTELAEDLDKVRVEKKD